MGICNELTFHWFGNLLLISGSSLILMEPHEETLDLLVVQGCSEIDWEVEYWGMGASWELSKRFRQMWKLFLWDSK
ncbi:hypothetical protein AAHE18_05G244300 [Arachis hypogaea]